MPQSRRVCLSDSGESGGNGKVEEWGLEEGCWQRRDGGGALAALAFHNLGAGVRDNLSSPVATSHYPPAPRFSLFDSVLPLRLSPPSPSPDRIFCPPLSSICFSLVPPLHLIFSSLSFTHQWVGFLPPAAPLPHFNSLSQIHHDLWWVRYYAAGDYI